MKENTNEKSLIGVSENSMFYKIKQFFKNLFHKNETAVNDIPAEGDNVIRQDENKRNSFMEEIRKIDDEETLLLKLQKKYRRGEIKEDELTEEQIDSLCRLYDKQIENLRKSNERRKQKLLEYSKKMQTEQ